MGLVTFGPSRLYMNLDRARAVFELREVQGYGGTWTGQFVANNRDGLSVGGQMALGGVELNGLLTDLAGVERLSGRTDLSLSFLGVGQSIDAIMKSLSGDLSVKMGQGTISGIDLDQLMRSGGGAGGTTIFDSLGLTVDIASGVARNEDLLLTLPGLEARGEGAIDIGNRTLDYLFTPVSLAARGGRGLAIPVRIKGSWDDPSIRADLGEAIDLNLAEERERLEQEARERLNRELEERLGVTVEEGQSVEDAIRETAREEVEREAAKELGVEPEEGQSVEDAVRDRIEDEIGEGLRNLLGR
jgi:Uncharacterized protein involved in outer membrane biogenesis